MFSPGLTPDGVAYGALRNYYVCRNAGILYQFTIKRAISATPSGRTRLAQIPFMKSIPMVFIQIPIMQRQT